MKLILSDFPKILTDISKCFCDEINLNSEKLNYIQLDTNNRKNINCITVKELQVTLKNVLKKIEALDVNKKIGISNFDGNHILRFRANCKNSKLRNIYFRLIHKDFFTHEKMKKYGMKESDKCPRCKMVENTQHLLYDCVHARNIWSLYNNTMTQMASEQDKVNEYDDIYKTCEQTGNTMV